MVDLDHINLRLLVTGFALLAAALAVGSVYWLQAKDTVDSIKIVMTATVWAAYGTTLGLRLRGWLVSRRLAWTCVALFAAALLSLYFVDASRHTAPGTATLVQQR